jgi:hypothetical protein
MVQWGWRALLKGVIGGAATLIILFPRIDLLVKQAGHLRDWDALIEPGHSALPEMNREIDRRLPEGSAAQLEAATVQQFVQEKVPYSYDWDLWGNIDYWPTVGEVVARRSEDCDGRAVLAASLLRARGFATAHLAGNFSHIWVVIDPNDAKMKTAQPVALMNPVGRASFSREGGKLRVRPPAWATVRPALLDLCRFPAWRLAALAVVWLGLWFHPCRRWGLFAGIIAVAFLGFWLLQSWGARTATPRARAWDGELIVVAACLLAAAGAALLAHRSSGST